MTRKLGHQVLVWLIATVPARAATQIIFKPITIGHITNVNATAINRAGDIVGTYMGSKGGHGFILEGRRFTTMPPLCHGLNGYCEANPTAINESGTVVGYSITGNVVGFVWQNGTYVTGKVFNVGGIPAQVNILQNKSGEVAFNYNDGDGVFLPDAGLPPSPQQVQGLPSDVSLINGLNDHGVVAGTTIPFGGQRSIFVDASAAIKTFAPPGAVDVTGGLINDWGQIAGTYIDAANVSHGFVRQHWKYNYFELPNGATSVAVDAINNAGRVAGVFTDSGNSVQQAFLFNGTTVTVFGQYPAADKVHLALSDRGELLLSDYATSTATYSSYRGTCSGSGC